MNRRYDRQFIRSEITKGKILDAAKLVFLEKGFKDATVTLIAEEAGLGYGTVYSHFTTGKDQVLLAIMEEVMQYFYQIAESEYTPTCKEEALQFTLKNTTNYLKLAVEYQKLLALFYEAIGLSPLIRAKWEEITESFIERITKNVLIVKEMGLIRNPQFDPRVVAGSLYYPGEQYLWKIALNKTNENYEEIASTIAEIYTYGLYK